MYSYVHGSSRRAYSCFCTVMDVLFKTRYSSESGEDGCLKIQGWKRIVNQMNIKHGDKLFSILHNGMWGVFFISPCGGDEE